MGSKAHQHRVAEFRHFEILKSFSVFTRKLFFRPKTFKYFRKVMMCLILIQPQIFQILNFSYLNDL
jgi:hypothetical protein